MGFECLIPEPARPCLDDLGDQSQSSALVQGHLPLSSRDPQHPQEAPAGPVLPGKTPLISIVNECVILQCPPVHQEPSSTAGGEPCPAKAQPGGPGPFPARARLCGTTLEPQPGSRGCWVLQGSPQSHPILSTCQCRLWPGSKAGFCGLRAAPGPGVGGSSVSSPRPPWLFWSLQSCPGPALSPHCGQFQLSWQCPALRPQPSSVRESDKPCPQRAPVPRARDLLLWICAR